MVPGILHAIRVRVFLTENALSDLTPLHMPFFRSRLLSAILFTLISIGQGFSFGYLYRQSQSNEKFQISLEPSQQEGLIICNSQFNQALSEKPFPTQSHEQVLRFRSEPFLPLFTSILDPSFTVTVISELGLDLIPVPLSPETPPPRVFS